MSRLHYSHMMKSWCKQPPNCAVCSVSLLSSLQKRQMISLIDYELEMYPSTQLLVFQDADSVSLLTLSKNKSWNTSDVQPREMYSANERVPWHSFICYGNYISEHLISGSSCIYYVFHAEFLQGLFLFLIYFTRCYKFLSLGKAKLNMWNEFVPPQKDVLLSTQPNFNDLKSHQVFKIAFQNLEKNETVFSALRCWGHVRWMC